MCKKKRETISNLNEYQLKLSCEKNKLHTRYLACIAAGICIWLIATGNAQDETFSDQLSFASTVTSIVLSVIAIIMSIFGNEKTTINQNRLEETSRRLEETSETIQEISKKTDISLHELKDAVNKISIKVDEMPNKIAENMFGLNKIDSQPEYDEIFNGGWINEE